MCVHTFWVPCCPYGRWRPCPRFQNTVKSQNVAAPLSRPWKSCVDIRCINIYIYIHRYINNIWMNVCILQNIYVYIPLPSPESMVLLAPRTAPGRTTVAAVALTVRRRTPPGDRIIIYIYIYPTHDTYLFPISRGET